MCDRVNAGRRSAGMWTGLSMGLVAACGALLGTGSLAAAAEGSETAVVLEQGATASFRSMDSVPVQLQTIRTLRVSTFGEVLTDETRPVGWSAPYLAPFSNPQMPGESANAVGSTAVTDPVSRGADCFFTSSHSTPPFNGGQYNAQAGFAENEWAIQSYTLPADHFPLQVNEMQILFVTSNAVVQTETQWTVAVWEGTPANGQIIAQFSSDGITLPHLTMGPGTNGTVLAVSVDPGDPNQIFVLDDLSRTFSFGFRIDQHNQQTGNGCGGSSDIPSNRNAFPATDTNGLGNAAGNWLGAINCGPLGCPSGFNRFSNLGFCTPSGDWAMSVSYEAVNCAPATGACCNPATGQCDVRTLETCNNINGTYQGDDTTCAGVNCPQPTIACCFAGTGGCLNLDAATCTSLGGQTNPAGSTCAQTVCFPEGACCLPDGTCADGLSPEECAMMNGAFQGDGTTCATTNCPAPTGSCCVGDNCAVLTAGDCSIVGGSWGGAGTTCADLDGDGTADACQAVCAADWDMSGDANIFDILAFLTTWNAQGTGSDFNNDGSVNVFDILSFLTEFSEGCP